MKSALDQVSDQYEIAKRAIFVASLNPATTRFEMQILKQKAGVWGHALMILQSCRGNFVG